MSISASKKAIVLRAISLFIALIFSLTCFSSCAASELRVVGTVGEYEVLYEELYFLATSYKTSLENKYGEYETLDAEKAEVFENELRELVWSNIVTNHAILSLCANEGLTLDSEGLDARVDEYVDTIIQTSFGGSKSEFRDSMREFGLTEHYVRFTAAVDFLYSDLLTKLLEESAIANDDAKIKEIVKNEFARTWHIMISNDEGESKEANRAKAEEALSKLRDGSMTMYKLIGSTYNEDLSITDLDGLYFAHGSMDEVYEAAAFALEVGEYSEVVETIGTNAQGQTVSAFYIIQRLEIEDEYVDANVGELKEEYANSVIYGMLADRKGELAFEPNDFCKGLMLSALETDGGFPLGLVIGLCAAVIACVGVAVALVIVKKKRTK